MMSIFYDADFFYQREPFLKVTESFHPLNMDKAWLCMLPPSNLADF